MLLSPIMKNVSGYYINAKKSIIHRFNPKKYQYVLKSKKDKCKISNLKDFDLPIPKDADSFTMVHIGKRGDKNYSKIITTFFNNNQILTKYTTYGDNVCAKFYDQKHYIRGDADFLHRTVKTFVHTKGSEPIPRYQKLEHLELTKKFKDSSVKYKMHKDENIFEGSIIKSKLREHENLSDSKGGKHSIEVDIKMGNDGIPQIVNQFVTKGVTLSEQDEFLPYRFIFDTSKKRLAFTNYFLKKYHLEDIGIKIKEEHLQKPEIGNFDEFEKTITYDKNASETIELAAHEVRHAYQYAQIGRLGKGYAPYCKQCKKKFGDITNPDELEQAYKFYIASENYPKSPIGKLYSENFLEKDAERAEMQALAEYSKGAKILASQIGRYI